MLRRIALVTAALVAVPLLAPPAAAASVSADIEDFAYEPDPIYANVGDVITWTNRDSATHTVTCDVESCAFESDLLGFMDTYTITLSESGTLSYFCQLHSSMTGRIFAGTGGSGPDLAPALGSLAASRPPLVAGVPVPSPTQARVGVDVANRGDVASGAFEVAFYSTSADGSLVLVGTASVASLAPGETARAEVAWPTAPLVGAAHVTAVVDEDNAVVESFETNNAAEADLAAPLV